MFATLRNRNFALLWFGQLGSIFGDFALFVALPFFVYDLTGSAVATGVMFMAQTLPRVLLASVAGVLVDRWDRRVVMIVADVVRGGTFLLVLLVRSPEMLWLLYAVAFINAAMGRLFQPAKNALVPRLVPPEHLTAANALNALSDNLARLVAPALGGVWYAASGLTPVLLVEVASFWFSAALLALVVVPGGGKAERTDAAPLSVGGVLRDLRDGLRVARGNATLRAIFFTVTLAYLTEGVLNALFVPFTREIVGGGAEAFGLIVAVQAVGGIAGSVLVGRLRERGPSPLMIALGAAGDGVCLLGCVTLPGRVPLPPLAVVMGLIAGAGVAVVAFHVGLEVTLQRTVSDAFRGRLFGAYYTLTAASMLVGQGVSSLLVAPLGVAWMFALGLVPEFAAAVCAFILLRRAARHVHTPVAATMAD